MIVVCVGKNSGEIVQIYAIDFVEIKILIAESEE
jgi:hypothetical protein